MKKNLILGAALAAIAFAGCNKGENNSLADELTALKVTSGILTRAYDNTWEADDAIGIYMLNSRTVEDANTAGYVWNVFFRDGYVGATYKMSYEFLIRALFAF